MKKMKKNENRFEMMGVVVFVTVIGYINVIRTRKLEIKKDVVCMSIKLVKFVIGVLVMC